MTSDIRLTDQAVIVDGRLGVGTNTPDEMMQTVGAVHSSGPVGGFHFDSRAGGQALGGRWVLYADQGAARLWSGSDWMTLYPNGTLSSYHYVIGSHQPKRGIDVDGGIHVRGGDAGVSFSDRAVFDYTDTPAKGQRWEWYATDGKARLWSGGDKLVVASDGSVSAGKMTIGDGKILTSTIAIKDGKIYAYTGVKLAPPHGSGGVGEDERIDLVATIVNLRSRIVELEKKLPHPVG